MGSSELTKLGEVSSWTEVASWVEGLEKKHGHKVVGFDFLDPLGVEERLNRSGTVHTSCPEVAGCTSPQGCHRVSYSVISVNETKVNNKLRIKLAFRT